jgi:ABC-type branched-subunit amino acid transport system substrate-binding protein
MSNTKTLPPAQAPQPQAQAKPSLPPPAPVPPPLSAPPPPPVLAKAPKEEVRAALLVPLTGASASLGQVLSNAAQMAVFETADTHFSLIPVDTRGTAEGAAAAARQALAQGADIVLGPLFSQEVKAAAPVAREQAVPILAFTTDRSALGPGVWSLGFLPGSQVKRLVSQALAESRSNFGLLAPDNDYGRAVAAAYETAVTEAGGRLVRAEFYDPNAREFTAVAKRFAEYERHRGELQQERKAVAGRSGSQQALEAFSGRKGARYDAVLLPDEGVRVKSVASLITYYGLDPGPVRFMGTMLWADGKVSDEPSLHGGWFPAPSQELHAQFEARYTKAFGTLPARLATFASAAYDATALAAALARQGQGDYPAAALTNPNGFAGVDGIFRLLPDGTNDRGLAVRELQQGGSKEVSPAPGSFAVPVMN